MDGGTFSLHAARNYGVQVAGVTLSRQQADYAAKRLADAGVSQSVQIRVQDYRDVDDGPYDAISSIGMAEHVGAAMSAVTPRGCLRFCVRRADCSTVRSRGAPGDPSRSPNARSSTDMSFLTANSNRWRR